jgi:hypothetical protein
MGERCEEDRAGEGKERSEIERCLAGPRFVQSGNEAVLSLIGPLGTPPRSHRRAPHTGTVSLRLIFTVIDKQQVTFPRTA